MSWFDYYFADAAADERIGLAGALVDLSNAMIDPPVSAGGDEPAQDNGIAPLYSYVGQLLSHDLVAPRSDVDQEDTQNRPLALTDPDLVPLERATVLTVLRNARSGRMNLESIYGDALSDERALALRDPTDTARMRVSPGWQTDRDLGDARNDATILLSNLVAVLLMFHNAVADELYDDIGDPEERFQRARQRVTWTWQWLIVNDFLPATCNPATLSWVNASRAPLYRTLLEQHETDETCLPVPIEFAFAVTGLPHTMLRAAYDLNFQFGRPTVDCARDGMPLEHLLGLAKEKLENPGEIEWDRLVSQPGAFPDRSARGFDTGMAHPLGWLPTSTGDLPSNLAARLLNAGYRLNMPTAQGVLKALAQHDDQFDTAPAVQALTKPEIESGQTGHAVRHNGFTDRTPLWFYMLKEAEIQTGGEHLGGLGSRLASETVLGVIMNDKSSYWHAPSDQSGPWTPERIPVAGVPIISFAALFQAAGVISADVPTGGSITSGIFTGV
ncbi:MAG: peroxidase family protein [Pseudomonadota bacterium]